MTRVLFGTRSPRGSRIVEAQREVDMSHGSEDPGHGHSVASWTTVIIVILAFTIGTFFFFLDVAVMVWLSALLAVVGLFAGLILRKAGYGVGGSKTKSH